MVEPVLTRWVFTVLFALISATCLLRLIGSGRDRNRPPGTPTRHEDVGHIVMGVSMIAMVLSWTSLLPTVVWIGLFGAQGIAFCAMLLRRRGSHAALSGQENWDHTHHVMASLAMVYMVVAMRGSAATGMSGMAGRSMVVLSPLAEAFGVYFLICAVWAALRAVRIAPSLATAGPRPAGSGLPTILGKPLLVDGCRALMGGGMAYLLLAA